MNSYKQFNQKAAVKWVARLKTKRRSIVNSFLDSVRHDDPVIFVNYVETALSNDPYTGTVIPSMHINGKPVIELTGNSLKSMPPKDLNRFYIHLKDLPLNIAASPFFWGAFTLSLIKQGLIQPLWLAHYDPSNKSNTVIENLDKAQNDIKVADRIVRRIIRSLFSPGLYRGEPELYNDCSFAKAWWCGRLSKISSDILNISEIESARALSAMWPTIATYLSGRLTVLREENIMAAMVRWYLDNSHKKIKTKLIKQSIKLIGELSSCHMICFYEPGFIARQLPEVKDHEQRLS